MMKKKLDCVLLVDDDEDCNDFHIRLLNRMNVVDKIEIAYDGEEALDFLMSSIDGVYPQPAIIFLDINMPGMDGWEFLVEYEKLDDNQKAKIVLVMLTTSLNPDDLAKAKSNGYVKDYFNKYLTEKSVNEIIKKHFSGHL